MSGEWEGTGYLYRTRRQPEVAYRKAVAGKRLRLHSSPAHALRDLCDLLLDRWFLNLMDSYVEPIHYYAAGEVKYEDRDQTIRYIHDGVAGSPIPLRDALGGGAGADLALARLEKLSTMSLLRPPDPAAAAWWPTQLDRLDAASGKVLRQQMNEATNPDPKLYHSVLNNVARLEAGKAEQRGQLAAYQVLFWCGFVVLARKLAVHGLADFETLSPALKGVGAAVAGSLLEGESCPNPYQPTNELLAGRWLVGSRSRWGEATVEPLSVKQTRQAEQQRVREQR